MKMDGGGRPLNNLCASSAAQKTKGARLMADPLFFTGGGERI
jgi:hypothetical protein